ncbi:CoA transferase [Acidiferrimicrobium sp. IK]|nr:CaiB/BaiF CoA-transferase family protein [Acidiferrimicrobium sp. IK]MCU4185917.1 CoA transferase [Acidiferrimicrobium sp. IK]
MSRREPPAGPAADPADTTSPQDTPPAQGPLHGVRVLEFAGIGPGPFCGMLLADLGADVVRVERPGTEGLLLPWSRDLLNRGKRSVAADLKTTDGLDLTLSLVAKADVAFEGFRPGVAERLGIGPEACWQRRPQLVYGRMTGWGQTGPLANTAGHDITYIAPTGALHAIGSAGGPPQAPLNLVGDFGGGALYLAVGLLAALHEARTSARGQVVDVAMVDGAAHLMTMFYALHSAGVWADERGTNLLDGGAPFYGIYRTADGEHIAVGALEPQFFADFVDRLGITVPDDAQQDPTTWPQLRQRITTAFASRTRQEWTDAFQDSDACVAPVLSMTEAPHHPHLRARNTFVEHDGIVQPGPAPRFSRTPGNIRRPPSIPGQHTEEVLAEWLGD